MSGGQLDKLTAITNTDYNDSSPEDLNKIFSITKQQNIFIWSSYKILLYMII